MSAVPTSKVLVLVSTPFQYLSALECIFQQYPGADIIVACGADCHERSASQLDVLFQQFPPTELINVKLQHKGELSERISSYSFLVKQLKDVQFSVTLIGDIRQPWIQDIACSVDTNDIILVDDGAATLSIYDYLLVPARCMMPVRLFDCSAARLLEVMQIKHRLGIKTQSRPLKIFSVFNFAESTRSRHQFSHLKLALGCPSAKGNYWHFIGSPVVEKNIASEAEYNAVLQDALQSQRHQGKPVYIAHRAEHLEHKHSKLVALGFEVINSEQPYELLLLQQPDYPASVVSFHSTCLFNVAVIFGSLVEKRCYKLSEPSLEKLKQQYIMQNQYSVFQHIDSIYQRLSDFNIDACQLTYQEHL